MILAGFDDLQPVGALERPAAVLAPNGVCDHFATVNTIVARFSLRVDERVHRVGSERIP